MNDSNSIEQRMDESSLPRPLDIDNSLEMINYVKPTESHSVSFNQDRVIGEEKQVKVVLCTPFWDSNNKPLTNMKAWTRVDEYTWESL